MVSFARAALQKSAPSILLTKNCQELIKITRIFFYVMNGKILKEKQSLKYVSKGMFWTKKTRMQDFKRKYFETFRNHKTG